MKKILIVEDDMNVVRALAIRLKHAGYEVHVANDAINAMAQAMKVRPDLMILDISLPGGNGFRIAERLQCVASTVHIPFIFLTASREDGLAEQARELGAVAFIEKPYDPEHLLSAVCLALGTLPEPPGSPSPVVPTSHGIKQDPSDPTPSGPPAPEQDETDQEDVPRPLQGR